MFLVLGLCFLNVTEIRSYCIEFCSLMKFDYSVIFTDFVSMFFSDCFGISEVKNQDMY